MATKKAKSKLGTIQRKSADFQIVPERAVSPTPGYVSIPVIVRHPEPQPTEGGFVQIEVQTPAGSKRK